MKNHLKIFISILVVLLVMACLLLIGTYTQKADTQSQLSILEQKLASTTEAYNADELKISNHEACTSKAESEFGGYNNALNQNDPDYLVKTVPGVLNFVKELAVCNINLILNK